MKAQLIEHGSTAYKEHDFVFERNYQSAAAYYKEHGDLEPPYGFIDREGIRLYDWFCFLREQFKKYGRTFLTEEQFKQLDAIGMRWVSKHDVQWDACFNCFVSYVKRTGSTDVGATYKEGDVPLGRWYRRQKELYTSGKLREDRTKRLLALGCELKIEDTWERNYQALKDHVEHTGSAGLPPELKNWLKYQMKCLNKGTLSEERTQKLRKIGIQTDSPDRAAAIHVSEASQTGSAVNG